MKKQKIKEKITKDITFAEILQKYPETAEVFSKYNIHCAGCPMAMQETIAEGAEAHGINIKKLIDELNKAVK